MSNQELYDKADTIRAFVEQLTSAKTSGGRCRATLLLDDACAALSEAANNFIVQKAGEKSECR